MILFLSFVLEGDVSQYTTGCPRTCSISQIGLKFIEIYFPPECAGLKGVHHYITVFCF